MNNKRNKLFSFHENHMPIPWHSLVGRNADIAIKEATLKNKASVIGRIGYILLSCGTGAWRVRSSMNSIARELGIMCSADIGLVSMEYTCIDKDESYTQSMTLTSTSVNTSKLARMETFVMEFPSKYSELTAAEIHEKLDKAEASVDSYSPLVLGFAAALACCGFTFLLGGGPIEMACAFLEQEWAT